MADNSYLLHTYTGNNENLLEIFMTKALRLYSFIQNVTVYHEYKQSSDTDIRQDIINGEWFGTGQHFTFKPYGKVSVYDNSRFRVVIKVEGLELENGNTAINETDLEALYIPDESTSINDEGYQDVLGFNYLGYLDGEVDDGTLNFDYVGFLQGSDDTNDLHFEYIGYLQGSDPDDLELTYIGFIEGE